MPTTAIRWLAISSVLLATACDDPTSVDGRDASTGLDGGPPDARAEPDAGFDAHVALDARADVGALDSGTDGGASCADDDGCSDDTRCVLGSCVPWPEGASDATCTAPPTVVQRPELRCRAVIPAGDPFPDHTEVRATPVVFDPDGDGPERPLVVAPYALRGGSYDEGNGILRVFHGDDCSLVTSLGGTDLDGDGVVDFLVSTSTPAVGDLDADGLVEVVAYGATGSTLAFRRSSAGWALAWNVPFFPEMVGGPCSVGFGGRRCPLGWAGPIVRDVVASPGAEVLRENVMLSATGEVLGRIPGYGTFQSGTWPAVGNLDADDAPELTNGEVVWEWRFVPLRGGDDWELDTTFVGPGTGHVVVAELDPRDGRELALVRGAAGFSILASDGTVQLGPLTIPGGGGGPPTIADVDGDGHAEIAVAGQRYLTVFDPDCGAAPRSATAVCELGTCDPLGEGTSCEAGGGIASSRSIQDLSSGATGVSAADVDGDGRAELVFGDECFTRVYDGRGEVLASLPRSSCTWHELPTIADADGDEVMDVVVGSSAGCDGADVCGALDDSGADSQDSGVRCASSSDCHSGSCVEGRCACETSAECCTSGDATDCEQEHGIGCRPAVGSTGGVCRAVRPRSPRGLEIWSAPAWSTGRSIWSDHPHVPGVVNEDGAVAASAEWMASAPAGVRFAPAGDAGARASFDLTTRGGTVACEDGRARLRAELCNRGALAAPPGAQVAFADAAGTVVCRAESEAPVAPGTCATMECTSEGSPTGELEVRAWGRRDASSATRATIVRRSPG